MDNNDIQLVGGPCGQHGSYTFYKAFKYIKNNSKRIVALSEFFFVKLWIDSDLLCIGELQLLWIDKNSEQMLASLRLYFLPENTPEGRMDHGEDEVLAISEKVVIKVEDLITWIVVDAEWTWGKLTICEADVKGPPKGTYTTIPLTASLTESTMDFTDVEKERKIMDLNSIKTGPSVIILSYPRYCRYRAMMRRLENVEDEYLKYKIVNTLGAFPVTYKNTRVLFCRDTFDYPELEGHELLCNHLAPKLKGRPRGKRKKRSVSPGSESNESESSVCNIYNSTKQKITTEGGRNGLRCNSTTSPRRSARSMEISTESKDFLKKLYAYMKSNHTPIGRIPSLGYKELDLYQFYSRVQKIGGYDAVSSNRLWKSIFDEMSGHLNSTSATTIIRRHYERFLLPYERFMKGEEYKPSPSAQRRLLKCKVSESSNDTETSEAPHSPDILESPSHGAQLSALSPTDKQFHNVQIKQEGKTSSLRSVRVKPERQKQPNNTNNDKISLNNNNITQQDPIKSEPIECKVEVDDDGENNASTNDSNNIVTMEPVQSPSSASELNCTKLVELDVQPITIESAQVLKSPQPTTQGKENKPAINEDTIKEPTPPINDVKSEPTEFKPYTFLHEVKKRKLDILKEGGLEVTPVRPSVIQQANNQIVSNNAVSPKRTSMPNSLNISHINKSPTTKVPNGLVPPRVVQSKSIYSYSEKTIYGNPKEIFMRNEAVVTPKFATASPRQSGGDLLDLSSTSPQKPVVEIMPVAQIPSSSHSITNHSLPKNIYGKKLGSNLEITLVGPTKPKNHHQIYHQSYVNSHSNKSYKHKSAKSGEDISRFHPPNSFSTPTTKTGLDTISVNKSHPKTSSHSNSKNNIQNNPPLPPTYNGYISQMYDGNKDLAPPYLALMDPSMYYSAMHSFYSNYGISSTPMPFPTPEQLKIYTEMIANNSRMPYQFQKIPDENKKS